MQPPPRKIKGFAAIKNIHSEQLIKLQVQHQKECDFLEDVRLFVKQRSTIEKEYAQGIQKLVSHFLQKKDQLDKGDANFRNIYFFWKTLLEKTDKRASVHLDMFETLNNQMQEVVKNLKNNKIQLMKKAADQASKLQEELQQCVREMDKSKKNYFDKEHLAKDARDKAQEAHEKLKRKNTKFYQSMNTLVKNSKKFDSKQKEYEKLSKEARNEYLLALMAANTHLQQYYSVDLPDLIKYVEGGLVEKLKEKFILFCESEIKTSKDILDLFNTMKSDAKQISTSSHLKLFMDENSIITDIIQYDFDPCEHDKINKVLMDESVDLQLNKEARKLARIIQKDRNSLRDFVSALHELHSQRQSEKPESEDPLGDLESQIDDLQVKIRHTEISKLKAEVKLQVLSIAGVDTDKWLNNSTLSSNDQLGHAASEESLNSFNSLKDCDDTVDIGNANKDHFSPSPSVVIQCPALYFYQACNPDELSFEQGEILELISESEGDGWILAKNKEGYIGYVPQNYLDRSVIQEVFIKNPIYDTFNVGENQEIGYCQALYDYEATCKEEISFLEGDIIKIFRKEVGEVDDGWWEGEINGRRGLFPSLVVEELSHQQPSESLRTPNVCQPPSFVPENPDLNITRDTQDCNKKPTSIADSSNKNAFTSEVSKQESLPRSRDCQPFVAGNLVSNITRDAQSSSIESDPYGHVLILPASPKNPKKIYRPEQISPDEQNENTKTKTLPKAYEKPEKPPKPTLLSSSLKKVFSEGLVNKEPQVSNTNVKPKVFGKVQDVKETASDNQSQVVEWETLV